MDLNDTYLFYRNKEGQFVSLPLCYSLVVHGEPVPHHTRVTTVKTGAFPIRSYKNPNLVNWQELISIMAQAECRRVGYKGWVEGPIALYIGIWLTRPKSRPKKYKWPDKKPDWDNVAKAGLDPIKRILIRDDNQVCRAIVDKRYAEPGDPPKLIIQIAKLPDDPAEVL